MNLVALAVACILIAHSAFAVVIVSEGFNGASTPDGWAVQVVTDPGVDPTITYVTASAHPAGFAPYEGTRFVRFNSYDCPSNASIRLKCTNGISSFGYGWIAVDFAWTEDNEYPTVNDFVTVQWSTNGTAWQSVASFYRYNAAGDAWALKSVDLPGDALNSTNLLVAFLFTSRYGNDCHLDAVSVRGEAANVVLTPETQTKQALPGFPLAYSVTVTNRTPVAATFAITYQNTNWSESGPATTGLLPSGGATTITVTAQVPLDAVPGDVNTALVFATQGGYQNSAKIVSRCAWTNVIFFEPFNTAASTNGWQTYRLAEQALGWAFSTASGNPAPSLRHGDVTVTTVVSNWIVAPALDFSGYDQITLTLDFITYVTAPRTYLYSGAFISTGSSNPASGDFAEVARASEAPSTVYSASADLTRFRGSPAAHFGLLYIGTNSHRQYVDNIRIVGARTLVDNTQLSGPSALVLTSGQSTVVLTGLLYRAGQTGGETPAPGYEMQIGYGDRDSVPGNTWTWFNLPYSGPADGNDAYSAAIQVTRSGEFDMAARARKVPHGSWVYGDLTGSTNGFNNADAIKLTSTCSPPRGVLLYRQTLAPPAAASMDSRLTPYTNTLAADDFSIASNVVIQTVRWAGRYLSNRNGSETGFWLRIYADNPEGFSHPGALLYEQFQSGYACEYGTDVPWYYQADLTNLFVARRNETYWFSAQLQCTGLWGIVSSPAAAQGMPVAQSADGGAQWTTNVNGLGMGFELYGKPEDSVGDGIPDWWRARYFGGDGTETNADSCSTADPDDDRIPNVEEFIADTDPTDSNSFFRVTDMTHDSPITVLFVSSTGRLYTMHGGAALFEGSWSNVPGAGPRPGAGGADSMTDTNEPPQGPFYRMGVQLP